MATPELKEAQRKTRTTYGVIDDRVVATMMRSCIAHNTSLAWIDVSTQGTLCCAVPPNMFRPFLLDVGIRSCDGPPPRAVINLLV